MKLLATIYISIRLTQKCYSEGVAQRISKHGFFASLRMTAMLSSV